MHCSLFLIALTACVSVQAAKLKYSSNYESQFLSLTNQWGVVTGQPTVVTSQPDEITTEPTLVTYQPLAASHTKLVDETASNSGNVTPLTPKTSPTFANTLMSSTPMMSMSSPTPSPMSNSGFTMSPSMSMTSSNFAAPTVHIAYGLLGAAGLAIAAAL